MKPEDLPGAIFIIHAFGGKAEKIKPRGYLSLFYFRKQSPKNF
jgi:hypothetical protein